MLNKRRARLESFFSKVFKPIEGYFIEDSKIIVSKSVLAHLWKISDSKINHYIKDGLPKSKYSISQLPMFDILECIEWYKKEKNNSKHRQDDFNFNEDVDTEVEFLTETIKKWEEIPLRYLPKDEIERRREIEKYEQDSTKTKVMQGDLIESDKIDFAKAESIIMVKSHLIGLKKAFPMIAGDRKPHEIPPLIDEYLKKMMNSLDAFCHIKIPDDDDNNFWDIITLVMELLKNGISPKDLIKRLNG